MFLVVLAIAWAQSGTLDKASLQRLVASSLERYKDVELGYEGWFEEEGGKRVAFFGQYARNGLDQSRLDCSYELSMPNGQPVEIKEGYGLVGGEFWELKGRGGRPGTNVYIHKALGTGSMQVNCSYERAFLLPLLRNLLDNRWSKVEVASQTRSILVIRVDESGEGGAINEFHLDIGKGCNVVKHILTIAGLGKLYSTTAIRLADFSAPNGKLWFPIEATYENFARATPATDLTAEKNAVRKEWYAVTSGAFRSPAGLTQTSFEPALDPQNTVYDNVRKGSDSRTRSPAQRQPTATEREAAIAKEMDRLEREGRLAGDAAKPPTDYWRTGLFALGGVLLGAAAVVAFRRSRG